MADTRRSRGGRYGRGGYRNNTRGKSKVAVGKEKSPDEFEGEDGNLLDGESLGPQDPNNFPTEDSDVGGPGVEVDKGGKGLPAIGVAVPPSINGEHQLELNRLEQEVEDDTELTPEVDTSEEEELVEEVIDADEGVVEPPAPVPQPTPDNLPSDDEMLKEMAEEPEDEEQVEGQDLTLSDIAEDQGETVEEKFGEPDPERQLHQEGDVEPGGSETAEEPGVEITEADVEAEKEEESF